MPTWSRTRGVARLPMRRSVTARDVPQCAVLEKFTADEMDFIDDRLGAILRVPIEMGRAARRVRPDLVYSILIENPALADGGRCSMPPPRRPGGHANLGTERTEQRQPGGRRSMRWASSA